MGYRSKKPCKKIGCKNLAIPPNKYCDSHLHLQEKEKLELNKLYDSKVRFKRDLKYAEFYRSKEWDKVRKARLALDTGLCQKCKKEGKITIADMVHHKVEIKDDWDKRLDIENLISLCNKCHNSIHKKT